MIPAPYTREEVEALRCGSASSTIRRLIATLDQAQADAGVMIAEAVARTEADAALRSVGLVGGVR